MALPLLPAGASAAKAAAEDSAIAPASAARAVLVVWLLINLSVQYGAMFRGRTSRRNRLTLRHVCAQPDMRVFGKVWGGVTCQKNFHLQIGTLSFPEMCSECYFCPFVFVHKTDQPFGCRTMSNQLIMTNNQAYGSTFSLNVNRDITIKRKIRCSEGAIKA